MGKHTQLHFGTDTSITIDADDNFLVYCDTDAKFSSPILEHYSSSTAGAHFKVKSTNTTSGYSKFSLISKNNNGSEKHGRLRMN